VAAGGGLVYEAVGLGDEVEMKVDVAEGIGVDVEINVDVCVAVGKFAVTVAPGMGVRVAMFGTQSRCPAKIVMEFPMQLPSCNCG